MRRFLLSAFGLLLVLLGAMAVRASRLTRDDAPVERVRLTVDESAIAQRLAGALRIATISTESGVIDTAAFRALHAYLAAQYPRTHATLTREVVGGLSLAYVWRGLDTTKAPIVLMGHLDVVPVIAGTESRWSHPPFGGEIADGFIWGRGAMDDKSTVLGVLEGIESLLGSGYTPQRTIVLAFGHDEEVGGRGAGAIVAWYKAKGWPMPALVLDEGGAVTQGQLSGIDEPVALVGIAEKGFLSLELVSEGEGGHSSTPSGISHIGRVSRAVAALEANPFPARVTGVPEAMLRAIAPSMTFGERIGIANLWLTEPLVRRALLRIPSSAAMLRTTTAPTIIGAGEKENVLPPKARAVVNFRILPGETEATVIARVRAVIADSLVQVRAAGSFASPPSTVSDPEGPAFGVLATAIRETLGDTPPVVAPYLVVGGTDSRQWSEAGATQVFRFSPVPFGDGDNLRFHGTDERVSVAGYARCVVFFRQLIQRVDRL
ncbi:MAG: M20 family peptidase [Gemmatimonadaceae bacterium]|nr:M20 family peptidase [Gemmatimonadaceae bacterium]